MTLPRMCLLCKSETRLPNEVKETKCDSRSCGWCNFLKLRHFFFFTISLLSETHSLSPIRYRRFIRRPSPRHEELLPRQSVGNDGQAEGDRRPPASVGSSSEALRPRASSADTSPVPKRRPVFRSFCIFQPWNRIFFRSSGIRTFISSEWFS